VSPKLHGSDSQKLSLGKIFFKFDVWKEKVLEMTRSMGKMFPQKSHEPNSNWSPARG
jgi:hypothetical protein